MADQKISELTELAAGNIADADEIAVVDTTAAATKRWTWASIKSDIASWFNSATATLTNKTISANSNTITDLDLNNFAADVADNLTFKDEDDFASNSASHAPTQQSTKAYVDSAISGRQPLDAQLTSIAGLTPGAEGQMITSDGLGGYQISSPGDVRGYLNVENGADVTDSANVDAAGAVMNSDTSTASMSFVVDEDDMVSDSATKVPTQQSVKAYVDANAGGSVDVVSNVAQDRVLGRVSAGNGDSEELTAAQVRTLINVEDGATADQTGAEIKAAYEGEADTNAFTDAEKSKLSGIETGADVTDETNVVSALSGATLTDAGAPQATDKVLIQDASDADNLKYVDFSDFSSGATVDVVSNVAQDRILGRTSAGSGDSEELTATQVRTFLNVEDGATADMTNAEIRDAYEANADVNRFTDADHSKLDGIEAGADVTDTANVTAAGALMDSEVTNLDDVKNFDPADYAAASHTHTLSDITDSGALAALNTVDTAQIDNDAVTFAKMQNISTGRLLGRDGAGTGSVEQLTDSEARTLLGLGTLATLSSVDTAQLADDAVEFAKVGAEYSLNNSSLATAIDWSGYATFEKTLSGNTTLTDSNLRVGTKVLLIDGNYTLTLPAYWTVMSGSYDGSSSQKNLITVTCLDATASSEVVVCTIVTA